MINISYTTVITAVFFFSLFSLCVLGYLKKKRNSFHQQEVLILLLLSGVISFRLLFPVELPITKSIYVTNFYDDFCSILRRPIIQDIRFFELLFAISIIVSFFIAVIKFNEYQKCYNFFKQAVVVRNISVPSHFKKKKMIPVVKSSLAEEPFIIGILSPRIVIPYFESLNEDYVIQHEIHHYINHDLFYKLCVEILVILFWWNPLLYLLRQYMENLLELKTDFSVTKHFSSKEKVNYAETLLFTAEKKRIEKRRFGLGISSTPGFLKTRIHSIFIHSPFCVSPVLLLTFLLTLFSYFVVIEPYSMPDLAPNEFLLENISYLEKNEDGTYTIYVDQKPIGSFSHIPEDFKHVKIIERK